MPYNGDTKNPNDMQPLVEAEPPEWHIFKALTQYRYDHPKETSNDIYAARLESAHTAYLSTFVGG